MTKEIFAKITMICIYVTLHTASHIAKTEKLYLNEICLAVKIFHARSLHPSIRLTNFCDFTVTRLDVTKSKQRMFKSILPYIYMLNIVCRLAASYV